MIGGAAGLYIVPLYTLLQHGAPKDSKGSLVATSNFLNVAGGLAAVIAFYLVTFVLQFALDLNTVSRSALDDPNQVAAYKLQLERQRDVPRYLFLLAGVLTVGMMFLLRKELPDFFIRSFVWMRSYGHVRPDIVDLNHLPGAGPVVIVSNAATIDDAMQLAAAADRYVRLVVVDGNGAQQAAARLGDLANRARVLRLNARDGWTPDWERALAEARAVLAHDDVVAVNFEAAVNAGPAAQLIERLREAPGTLVVPVRCSEFAVDTASAFTRNVRGLRIAFGAPLGAEADWDEALQAMELPPEALAPRAAAAR
jgi:hypothetical protein